MSPIEQFYLKSLTGMNNKVEDLDLQEKWVQIAQNARFENEPGAVDKRPPIMYFNGTTIGSGAIQALYRYYTSGGVTKFIAVHEAGVYVGDDAAGTFTSIRTLGNTGKRCSFITYKDLLIGSNGYDNIFVYDGSSDNVTWELGSCKAITGDGTGITKTALSYAVVFTVSGVDYINGAVSNTIASLTNEDVDLTHIPLGPAGCTARKIYRKDSSTGSAYKLVTTISDNSTVTYTDTDADVSGEASMAAVTDDMPKGFLLTLHRERLFISGDPNDPSKIYYSNPYLPHYILQTTNLDYMLISQDDNDEITGIPIYHGVMLCIKKNTIRKVHIANPTDGFDPAQWYADDPIVFIGSPAPWSIVTTPLGVIFLGWDHWYSFDGASVNSVIDEFDTSHMLPALYNDVQAFFTRSTLFAAYADTDTATQYFNRIMVYNFNRKALAYDTVDCNCFAAKEGGDEYGDLYYGGSQSGYVYAADTGAINYRLIKKADCEAGTTSTTFVGGTEASPYIEIGSITTAAEIPDDICILWDSLTTEPGSGWTEITGLDNMFVKVDAGETPGDTGTVGLSDGETDVTITYKGYRIFKKNNTTTEYTFPIGAIVFYDQGSNPTGFLQYDTTGYVKLSSTLTGGTEQTRPNVENGTAENLENSLSFRMIKKLGEQDTWDGTDKYVYCLYYGTGTPTGWTNMTSTYDGNYMAIGDDGPDVVAGGDTVGYYNYTRISANVETPTAGHGYSQDWAPGTAATPTYQGTEEQSYDEDGNTYYGSFYNNGADGSAYVSMVSQHTWTTAVHIDQVYCKAYAKATPYGNYKQRKTEVAIYVQQSAAWVEIYSNVSTDITDSDPYGSNYQTYDGTLTNAAAGWDDVTGVKVLTRAVAYSYEGNRQQSCWAWVYDIQAQGKYGCAFFNLAKMRLAQMLDYNAALVTPATAGTWTSPSVEINAMSFQDLKWNEVVASGDDLTIATRTGATKVACEAASWSAELTKPNGSTVASTANVWFQYRITFSAVDSTVSNPKIYFTNGFVVKLTYYREATFVESSVEFIYDVGLRNFKQPMLDKLFKKIATHHEGDSGSFIVDWETENGSGSFEIDLTTNPSLWNSFFPSDAMGTDLKVRVYKNDLNDFRLKEFQGAYESLPIII